MILRKDSKGNYETFKTKTEAAYVIGVNESSIRKAIKEFRLVKGEYRFFFINNESEIDAIKKYYDGFKNTSYCQANLNKSIPPESVYSTATYDNIVSRKNELPKILVIDIETAPLIAYTWGLWKQNIGLDQIISNWFCLTWSAKWLFSDTIISERLTGTEVKEEDDKRIIKKLWTLLDKADIIIAHNGDGFDIPRINSRFIIHNLPPTSHYKTIDTLKIARAQFGFSSNKLEALARQFGFDGKLHTGFDLWKKCMQGDEDSLEYMETYNRQDVELLEEVYLKLRPYIKQHPNLNLYMETTSPCCANCGSKNIKEDSYYYTTANRYIVYRCECGALSRARLSDIKKEERKNIILSI